MAATRVIRRLRDLARRRNQLAIRASAPHPSMTASRRLSAHPGRHHQRHSTRSSLGVAAVNWVYLEPLNGFENLPNLFGDNWAPLRYRLTLNNIVHLEGLVKPPTRPVRLADRDRDAAARSATPATTWCSRRRARSRTRRGTSTSAPTAGSSLPARSRGRGCRCAGSAGRSKDEPRPRRAGAVRERPARPPTFEAVIDTGDTGLAGSITVEANDNVGGTAIPATALGITEIAAGVYAATGLTAPDTRRAVHADLEERRRRARHRRPHRHAHAPSTRSRGRPTRYATVDELSRILQLTHPVERRRPPRLQRVLDAAAVARSTRIPRPVDAPSRRRTRR